MYANTNRNVTAGLPLFMQEGGEAKIAQLSRELTVYLNLLNADPATMIRDYTLVALNPDTVKPHCVGKEQARDIQSWFDSKKTKKELFEWFGCGTHTVDGKSWCCGGMGSRWADKEINGRKVRFAFYKPEKNIMPEQLKHCRYQIILDASA